MNKILQSIFKIWNFLPLFQILSLWLNKTPPKWNSPLSVQEGFDISFLKYYFSPPFEHNRIPIDKTLWKPIKFLGNTKFWNWWWCGPFALGSYSLPLLAWIAKNGIIRALEVLSSPLVVNKWVKIIPKTKSSPFALGLFLPQGWSPVLLFDAHFSPNNREFLGVMAKYELRSGSLCLRRRLQFPFNIPMTPVSRSRCPLVPMGVLMGLASFIPNLVRMSWV